jgi:hypothetical protein
VRPAHGGALRENLQHIVAHPLTPCAHGDLGAVRVPFPQPLVRKPPVVPWDDRMWLRPLDPRSGALVTCPVLVEASEMRVVHLVARVLRELDLDPQAIELEQVDAGIDQ